MNILFILPYVPSKIRVRPFHMIKGLSERHDVRVIALGEVGKARTPGVEELKDLLGDITVIPHSKLRGVCQSLLALASSSPMCTAYCRSSRMRKAIAQAVARQRIDVVHVEHLRAAHFAPFDERIPAILDSVDCLTGLFGQMAHSKGSPISRMVMAEETFKLRRYEPKTMRGFDRVLVTSEFERQALLDLDRSLNVDVVPNGVDTDYFAPQGSTRKPARMIFSGKMSYAPNARAALWFAERVLPAIQTRFRDSEFVVVGSDPPAEVRKLSEIPGVTVTGYVDDIRPYLDSASVAVVPIQVAVGVQNKALEAMAMGLPVVAAPIAARTFGRSCPGIIEAESAEDMAREVSRLIERPAEAAEIGRQAREEARKRFSWQTSVQKLEEIYEDVVGNRTATAKQASARVQH